MDPEGVSIQGTFVVPVGESSIGSDSYPPTSEQWQNREDLEGAVIEAGRSANIVWVVERNDDDDGRIAHMQLSYAVDSSDYAAEGTIRYVFQESCF